MSSKWCSKCKVIVTTNTIPKYCAWCGKDLREEQILPEFNTWEERLNLIAELTKQQPIQTVQLSLF